MNIQNHIGDLFDDEPQQWGLRGDPYLWRELRVYFANTPVPNNVAALEQTIEQAFFLLTGHSISSADHFRIERFAHGGMSSGGISPAFWRERALPLLKKRYAET